MGDRVRLGELLAAIGAIVLTVMLAIGAWFEVGSPNPDRGLPGGLFVSGTAGSTHLGWFAFAIAVAADLAAVVYLLRVLTAKNSERVMLQAPVAYAVGLFATIVVLVRMVLFTPGFTETIPIAGPEGSSTVHFDGVVTGGGWIGLIALALIPIGAWLAMADERTDSAGARRRTNELLADVPIRPAPLVGAVAVHDPESAVVADDAAGDDSPSEPASGGPA